MLLSAGAGGSFAQRNKENQIQLEDYAKSKVPAKNASAEAKQARE